MWRGTRITIVLLGVSSTAGICGPDEQKCEEVSVRIAEGGYALATLTCPSINKAMVLHFELTHPSPAITVPTSVRYLPGDAGAEPFTVLVHATPEARQGQKHFVRYKIYYDDDPVTDPWGAFDPSLDLGYVDHVGEGLLFADIDAPLASAPKISLPAPQTIDPGQSVDLVPSTSEAGVKLAWLGNGFNAVESKPYVTASDGEIQFIRPSEIDQPQTDFPNISRSYQVVGIDSAGVVHVATTVVDVRGTTVPLAVIAETEASGPFPPGDEVRLVVNTTGGIAPYVYSWSPPPQLALQDGTAIVQLDQTTDFMVTVRDAAGTETSDTVRVEIGGGSLAFHVDQDPLGGVRANSPFTLTIVLEQPEDGHQYEYSFGQGEGVTFVEQITANSAKFQATSSTIFMPTVQDLTTGAMRSLPHYISVVDVAPNAFDLQVVPPDAFNVLAQPFVAQGTVVSAENPPALEWVAIDVERGDALGLGSAQAIQRYEWFVISERNGPVDAATLDCGAIAAPSVCYAFSGAEAPGHAALYYDQFTSGAWAVSVRVVDVMGNQAISEPSRFTIP